MQSYLYSSASPEKMDIGNGLKVSLTSTALLDIQSNR